MEAELFQGLRRYSIRRLCGVTPAPGGGGDPVSKEALLKRPADNIRHLDGSDKSCMLFGVYPKRSLFAALRRLQSLRKSLELSLRGKKLRFSFRRPWRKVRPVLNVELCERTSAFRRERSENKALGRRLHTSIVKRPFSRCKFHQELNRSRDPMGAGKDRGCG